MSETRSGFQYRGEYDFWNGLQESQDDSRVWPSNQIQDYIEQDLRGFAETPGVNTNTGNIAAILAKFEGREIYYQKSYSSSSSLPFEIQYQNDLSPATTSIPGAYSLQGNDQYRNHTEPKLLQEFDDRFLKAPKVADALRWVCLVSDRPVCGSCRTQSVEPFWYWCKEHGVAFSVIVLDGTLNTDQWRLTRTDYP